MKGRMFVVDSQSLQDTIANNIATIRTPNLQGVQWLKTLADIMADILRIDGNGSLFTVNSFPFSTKLLGEFNIYNCLTS